MNYKRFKDPMMDRLGVNPKDAAETLQTLWTPGQEAAPALDLGAECILRLFVPKKVRYIDEHNGNPRWEYLDQYRCPTCNRQLRKKQLDPHCPTCGQLLDWEV